MPAPGNRQSFPPEEDALPKGHPCRPDYDPASAEAKAWRQNQAALEQTSGYPPNYAPDETRPHGGLVWVDGVDPMHPELEPHTGLPRSATRPGATGEHDAPTHRLVKNALTGRYEWVAP